jgi:hypothetical protein
MEDMPVEFRTGYFVECVDAYDHMTAFVAGGTWRAGVAWAKICVDTTRLKWRGDVAWAKYCEKIYDALHGVQMRHGSNGAQIQHALMVRMSIIFQVQPPLHCV